MGNGFVALSSSAVHWSRTVIFDKRDGLYWLSGSNLAFVKEALRRDWQGEAVGFDYATASWHARGLLERHVRVMYRDGDSIQTLTIERSHKPSITAGIPLDVTPEALIGTRELERLGRLAETRPAWRQQVHMMEETLTDDTRSMPLYVYEVAADWYDVDWELTSMSEKRFEAVILAAHRKGRALPCRLVPPKPRRRKRFVPPRTVKVSKPVTHGQLRLAI
jgi:hypothetical protein